MKYENTNKTSRTETHLSIVLTMNNMILAELETANLQGSEKWVHGQIESVNIRVYTPDFIEVGKKVFFKLQAHHSPFGHESRRAIFCLNGNLSEATPIEDLDVQEIAEQIAEFFNFRNCNFGVEKVLKLLNGTVETGEEVRLKTSLGELLNPETPIEALEYQVDRGQRW